MDNREAARNNNQSTLGRTPLTKVFLNSQTSPEIIAVPVKEAGVRIIRTKCVSKSIKLIPLQKNTAKLTVSDFANCANAPRLAGKTVIKIVEDNSGNLWFTSNGSGASCCKGKIFNHYIVEHGLAGNIVFSIAKVYDGMLWFGAESRGISRYDRKLNCYNDNGSVFEIPFLISNEKTVKILN